jgi:transposase
MSDDHTRSKKKQGNRHLTPLEIATIHDAVQNGTKVASLAQQFKTSRQTIYNALQSVKEHRVENPCLPQQPAIGSKRKRTPRISPEITNELIEFKRKYPTWGIEYLRNRWIQMGKPPIAKSTIYKILKEAQLIVSGTRCTPHYQRFEMMRPGQLYQMDIQGKIYLPTLGWVHGFAILDDYSRFIPACRYYSDMRLSNAILTLNSAIIQYGIPEAIYVDNGSQFRSRGERMNNFELFCQAYGIKVINATPYRPEGKGKIERFFETLEAQFIAEVKQKINESPTYSLEQLNLDLANYLKNQYFERIHGGTHAKPIDRFKQTVLPPPNPPLEVDKFLERTESRNVNKFREISYQGYKIQVDLVPGSKVHVIDMLESIRIEYQDQFIREINKVNLTKIPTIKIQNGVSEPIKTERSATKPDQDGYYHRIVSTAGTFKIGDECYYLDKKRKGQKILIQLTTNNVRIYDNEKQIIESLEKKTHKADFIDFILTKANQ